MRLLCRTLCLAACLSLLAQASTAQPTLVAESSERMGPLVRTESVYAASPDPLDTFRMVRLAKDVPVDRLRGVVFLLPPLGPGYRYYEQRDTNGAFGSSMAEFFALRGYDVFTYGLRFEGIPAGSCENGLVDCSVMASWDLRSVLDDVAFVRERIEALHPGGKVVAGGNSLGAILAVALANEAPADYAGILVWEGMLVSNDPAVLGLNDGYCDALEAQLAAGFLYDGLSGSVLGEIVRQAEFNPAGLTSVPLFPPFLTNRQALIGTITVPTPGPFTMPVPDYVLVGGSLAEERLFHASEERFADSLELFASYAPLALVRDINCSLAGRESAFTADLGSYTGSVLVMAGGRALGPYIDDQVAAFGSADVSVLVEEDFGHVDHFMTPRHRRFLERPILRWLRSLP